ncbi:MAG: MFS transporter [Actinobacteria bacterium RBG_16_64_13]|nr:MAG: MFS transporter [Actinobacteria bacterium RBG_16_64_13]
MTTADPSSSGRPDPGLEQQVVSRRDLAFVMVALLIAMLLAALDQVIFATALPTIVGDLGGVDQMLWVTTAYLLAATIMMPIYGKLGDLIGHKVLFLGALVAFLSGSVLGGLAHNMAVLVAARAVQGLGGGGLMILSMAIIADIVPPRQRGTYMGIMGGAWSVSSVLGPILGGWFADSIGWRWAFWFNLPLAVLAVVAASAFLKMPAQKRDRPTVDVIGIATMAISVTAIILVTSWGGREYPWDSPTILGLVGIAVAFATFFVLAERRAVHPVIPLHLFGDRNFNLSTAGGLFLSIAMFGVIAYLPSYLQMVGGLSATKSGLLLAPMSAGILITSVGSGALASRTGRYKWMPIASCVIVGVGLFLLSTMAVDDPLWKAGVYIFICGAGTGLSFQIVVLIVQNAFPLSEVGTATAGNIFFRQIGAAIGSAAVGTVFTKRLMDLLGERLVSAAAGSGMPVDPNSLTPALVNQLPEELKNAVVSSYSEALTPVFLYLLPLMALGVVLFLFVKEKPLADSHDMPAE